MAPGRYSVEMMVVSASGVRPLGEPQSFTVKPVPNALPGTDYGAVAAFQQETAELMRRIHGADQELDRARERLRYLRAAVAKTPRAEADLQLRVDALDARFADLAMRLGGDPVRERLDQSTSPGISDRVREVIGGHWNTRQKPTSTQREQVVLATKQFEELSKEIGALITGELTQLEAALAAAGAPLDAGPPA